MFCSGGVVCHYFSLSCFLSTYMYMYVYTGVYEPPKAARSIQLRRTAFAFTRI